MTTVGEQHFYKLMKKYMTEAYVIERFKDIHYLMKRDRISFIEAQAKCLDTTPGSIRKEGQKVQKQDKKVLNLQLTSV